jgi:hypothetical protein
VPHPRSGREPIPDLRPAPGPYLLAGINTSLTALAAPTVDPWQLADDLKTALARTAACGDTCRVRPAADAVRSAATLLYAGATTEAHPLLLRARALLTEPRDSARPQQVSSQKADLAPLVGSPRSPGP